MPIIEFRFPEYDDPIFSSEFVIISPQSSRKDDKDSSSAVPERDMDPAEPVDDEEHR
jgi:hypothetical protein